MKLGSKSQYAVMAMVDLALNAQDGPVTLASIAERQQLPVQYLEQLFSKLRRMGLVESLRGTKGGYRLAKSSSDIAIADVVLAVDEPIQTTRCRSDSPLGCQGKTTKCLTHALWIGLEEHITTYLKKVSLDHICQKNLPRWGEEL